jgi:hypothetical protein
MKIYIKSFKIQIFLSKPNEMKFKFCLTIWSIKSYLLFNFLRVKKRKLFQKESNAEFAFSKLFDRKFFFQEIVFKKG